MAHKIERAVLAQRIRELDGLTNDERSALLELLNTQKHYGLVWEDKPETVEERLREQLPVLTEVKHRAIINGSEHPNHIIIEGDNLEALTALSYTHEGKIDVIYIDPPYNTGNKDFVYNDNYVDAEDGYRHSKWLSFMSRRLKIAKHLLSDKGVIFISIDYYSFAQLKLLCDDIFEYSSNPENWNFLDCLIWNKQHSQQQGIFKRYHEFVLVYAKQRSKINNVLSKAEGLIEAGALKKISKKNPASTFYFPKGVKFEAPDGTILKGAIGDSEKVFVKEGILAAENGRTKYPVLIEAGWTQKKQMESWFSGLETLDTKGQKVVEFYFNSTGKLKCRKERGVVTPCSILPEFGMGSEQTDHLKSILGKSEMFSNPKPVEMIKLFSDWFCPKNGIILDFFAGSGTTLESTMQLNAEDGGHRQCILVTNNENNICEEVTYERNKRVINGYTTPKGVAVEGLHENNLRYYKVGFVPRENTLSAKRQLMAASTDLLCIKNGIYTEQSQFGTLALKPNIARYFEENGKRMLVIFREEAIEKLVAEIKRMTLDEPIVTYVFSSNNYAMDADFEEVEDKVSLCALPAAIYNAYLKVLPKRKAKNPENEDAGESGESMEEQQKLDFGEEETL